MRIIKKKSKKSYSSDHVAVMLEDMSGQFKAFGEGLSSLSEQFEGFGKEQKILIKRVDVLEIGQKGLSDKVDKMEIKLDSVAADVIEIKHKLSQKVDLEDFQKLEKKVLKLEKLILSKAV